MGQKIEIDQNRGEMGRKRAGGNVFPEKEFILSFITAGKGSALEWVTVKIANQNIASSILSH